MTRGGRSGLSWIWAWTVPRSPGQPPAAVRRGVGLGRAVRVGGEVADALADQAEGVAALGIGGVEGDVLGEQRVGGGVVPGLQEAVDLFLGREGLRPGGACLAAAFAACSRLSRAGASATWYAFELGTRASSSRPVSGDIGA